MREIKFRVFDEEIKQMVYPHERSDLSHHVFLVRKNGISYLNYQNNAMSANIMQFTGLKDKNGKEIYEGDIVQCKHSEQEKESEFYIEKGVISFYQGGFRFNSVSLSDWYTKEGSILSYENYVSRGNHGRLDIYYKRFDLEVIGNIHENPELS